MIERGTGYQNMYNAMCLSLGMTEKNVSDGKKCMFFMHALLRFLPPYFNYADPGERGRRKQQETKMISRLCSTNPESFRRF